MGGSVNRLVAGAEAELARQALEEADAALLRISRAHDRADDAQPDWLDEAEVALTHAASPGASSSAAALFSPPTVARDPPGELPPVEDGDASPPAPPIDANMSASFPDSDEGFERGLDAFERLLDAERRLSESEDEVRRTRRDSDAAAARHEAELSLIRREARRESDEAAAHAAAVSVAHNATHEAVLAEETHMLSHTPFLSPCSGSADTPRPSWTPDEAASQCEGVGCISGQWNIFNRRHHCRSCGGLFCDRCTQARVTLAHLGYPLYEEQRVCEPCRKSVEEA